MFHLRVEFGPQDGERIPLPAGGEDPVVLTIGRGADVDLRFSDSTISRLQAELRREGGAWSLQNRSQHGTYVDRKLVTAQPARLRPGSVLILGETRVVFAEDAPVTPPGDDSFTPKTPTIAAPPSAAGYDSAGQFHSGQTLLGAPDDLDGSFIWLMGGPDSSRATLRVKRRRLYFLAIVLILGLVGCLATGLLIVLPTLRQHPGTLLAATLFGLAPAIPYLALIKFLDRNDQIPAKNLLACIVWGGTAGCGLSLVLNSLGGGLLGSIMVPAEAWSMTAVLVAPLVEEVTKGAAVLVLFWILHDEFDNVLEGLILGAASGLGFALVENCIYNVRFLVEGGAADLLVMGSYRAVVNALIGHPVYTAMTGAGLGLLRETQRDRRHRVLFPLLGLATAIGMHVAWNAAAVYLSKTLGGSALTLAANTAAFGGAGLLFFVAAYVFAARRERRVLVTYLAEEVDKGFVEEGELDSFQRPLGRLRYELGGLFRHGPRVYLERKGLRRAQVELAFRKWHLAQGDAAKGSQFDRYVKDARDRIRDARNRLNQLEGRTRTPTEPRIPIPFLPPDPAPAAPPPPPVDDLGPSPGAGPRESPGRPSR